MVSGNLTRLLTLSRLLPLIFSTEQPNLGAFTTVLREWNYLQPPRRMNPVTAVRQASSTTTSATTSQTQSYITPSDYSHSELEYDSDPRPEGSTVWSHKPIASYLKLEETATETDQDFDEYYGMDSDYLDIQSPAPYPAHRSAHTPSPHASSLVPTDSEAKAYSDVSDEQGYYSSDTEGDPQSRTVYIEDGSDLDLESTNDDGGADMTKDADEEEEVMPTLGFQETLNFLADEREKLSAQRDAGATGQYNGRLVSLSAAAGVCFVFSLLPNYNLPQNLAGNVVAGERKHLEPDPQGLPLFPLPLPARHPMNQQLRLRIMIQTRTRMSRLPLMIDTTAPQAILMTTLTNLLLERLLAGDDNGRAVCGAPNRHLS